MPSLELVLAADLEEDLRPRAQAIAAGIRAEVPELFADARYEAFAQRGIEALLVEFASVLRHGLGDVRAPHAAVAFARSLADAGVALDVVLRSYRIGQEAAFGRAAEVAGDADEDDPAAAVARVGMLSFRFTDAVMTDVAAAFEEQRERHIRQSLATREAIVARLLAGERVDGAEAQLGYRLDGAHLAMVGDDVAAVVRALHPAQPSGVPGTPSGVPGTPALVVGVGGWVRPGVDWSRLEGTGLRVAVGGPAAFADAFAQAQRAATVAHRTTAAVTHYADVALLALLLDDPAAAERFAAEELGEVAHRNDLQTTLRAYFDAGHDQSATAAALGVHRNTVSRRLAQAEALLGHPLGPRRRELEAALMIHGV